MATRDGKTEENVFSESQKSLFFPFLFSFSAYFVAFRSKVTEVIGFCDDVLKALEQNCGLGIERGLGSRKE